MTSINDNELSVHEIQTCCDIAGIMYRQAQPAHQECAYVVSLMDDIFTLAYGIDIDEETAWNRAWDNYVDQLGETR